MTPQQAKELLPIITAFSKGKLVEHKSKGQQYHTVIHNPDFTDSPEQYRIRQEPKLRPWKPEEVPVGAVVSSCFKRSNRYVITAMWAGQIHLNGSPCEHSNERPPLLHQVVGPTYHYTTDFGKTWLPCGISE